MASAHEVANKQPKLKKKESKVPQRQTPSRERARLVIGMLLDNALRLLDCGETLARGGQYGVARSLVILAGEEASRALFYALYALGVDLPPEALGHTSHRRRHDFISGQMRYRRLAFDGFVPGIDFTTRTPPSDDEMRRSWTDFRRVVDEEAQPRRAALEAWWRRANDAKNAGFYVDFVDNVWRTPAEVSSEEFHLAVDTVQEFMGNVTRSINGFLNLPESELNRIVKTVNELSSPSLRHGIGSS